MEKARCYNKKCGWDGDARDIHQILIKITIKGYFPEKRKWVNRCPKCEEYGIECYD